MTGEQYFDIALGKAVDGHRAAKQRTPHVQCSANIAGQRSVFLWYSGKGIYADVATFALRAHAAQDQKVWCGLIADIRRTLH